MSKSIRTRWGVLPLDKPRILIVEDDLDLAKSNMRELQLKVALKKILYFDPSADITDDLLKAVNKAYKASRK